MTVEINCAAKHSAYQPPDEKWRCPKCGVNKQSLADFYIEDSAEGSHEECCRLHDEDTAVCTGCGYCASGKSFSKRIAKLDNQVPCPHCRGTGHVTAAESSK